jgi:hypothetical protein
MGIKLSFENFSGFILAGFLLITANIPNLLSEKLFSLKSVILISSGVIVVSITVAAQSIVNAIKGLSPNAVFAIIFKFW